MTKNVPGGKSKNLNNTFAAATDNIPSLLQSFRTDEISDKMAAEGCTVIVSGLPTNIEEDRLTDKLLIHFLRCSHGGGEVTSVNIIKNTSGSALITFEESKVAQSVVQYGKHILLVDDNEYELIVSFSSKEVHQDKVFIFMTVTVDYNWLPLGKEAVTSVQKSSPDVQCGFNRTTGLCTLSGGFSVVQAMVAQLLDLLEKPARRASGPDLGGLGQVSPDTPPCKTLESRSGTNNRRGAEVETLLEDYDHSLIVDLDTFRYLQTRCEEEYGRVLSRHGVEAVDCTRGGVTTLFLQAKQGQAFGERGLQEAHRDLSRLCQDTESRLCKEQLLKERGPREGLQQALEVLQEQLPRLLLGEDRKHISIVGSSSDVMEAKRFLLDLRTDEEARLRPRLGSASNASQPDAGGGKTLTTFMGGSLEGGSESSLAATLRDTQSRDHGQDKLGTGLDNTLLTPSSAVSASSAFREFTFARKQSSDSNSLFGSGPVFDSGQIFGKERQGVGAGGLNLEDQRKFGPTGQDIPFEKFDPLSAASVESRPFLSSTLIGSGLPSEKLQVGGPLSTVQYMDLFEERRVQTATVPHSESGFKLRRANSFSGYARNTRDQKVGDAGGYGEKLSKGNASTAGTSRDEQELYSVEVQASTVMWEYMKEAYRTRLEDIISGSQMKQSQSDSGFTTIILRGTEVSRLDGCQRELKNMITMVATDFDVLELPLAKLGMADPQDETLEICCEEVRSRFQKVKIQKRKEILLIIGPRQLCAQVVGILVEVFHDGTERRKRQQEVRGTLETSLTTKYDDRDQSSDLVLPDSSQEEPVTQKKQETRFSGGEQSRKAQKASRGQQVSQSAAQKEPVIMEKLRKGTPRDGKHGRVNAALFTRQALASTWKAAVTTSTGPLSQSGLGNPYSESRGRRGQNCPGSGSSQDQD